MIIEKIDTFPLRHDLHPPYGDANGLKRYRATFLVRITTSSGISGWGECVDWLPALELGFREQIIPFLIGKKATDRLVLTKKIAAWHARSAAAVSMALTEIVATAAGLNVTDLWGGRFRDEVPVYASFQSYSEHEDWIAHSIRLVEQAVTEGHRMLKIKVGGRPIREDQAHVQAIQDMLGGRAQLAIDANESYDLAEVKAWLTLLERWDNWMWFEEPIPMDRVDDYVKLRQMLSLPVAGGENLTGPAAFYPHVQARALDILQPDVVHHSSIDAFRDTLQLGRHAGIRVSAHSFDGGLARLYALYAQACVESWSKMDDISAIEPIEWDYMENPYTDIIGLKPVDGKIKLPTGVGIGVPIGVTVRCDPESR